MGFGIKQLTTAFLMAGVLGAGTAFAQEAPGQPGDKKEITDATKRIVRLIGSIDTDKAQKVNAELRSYDDNDPGKPIILYINSVGGTVKDGMNIIDVMKSLRSPVQTVCEAECLSMGAVILAAGTKGLRSAHQSALVMTHDVSGEIARSTYTNVEKRVREIRLHHEQIVSSLMESTGKSRDEVTRQLANDEYMTSEEAVTEKLIDKVIRHGDPLPGSPPRPPGPAPQIR